MGAIKKTLLVISLLVVIIGVIHEYSPGTLSVLYQIPGLREWAQKIHFYLSFSYWGLGPSLKKTTPTSQDSSDMDWAKLMEEQGLAIGDDIPAEKIFTKEELAKANGANGKIFLALLGRVYDVTDGKAHYGPGGGYEFFAGRDASRAFVTGDFTPEGLIDDVDGLSDADLRGLDEWTKFYDREYSYVGKVAGKFYDERGRPTAYQKKFSKDLRKSFKSKDAEDSWRKLFPPCNSEWKQGSGGRVWCSEKSGGVERTWSGVPRKFYEPGTSKFRCACVKNFGSPTFNAGIDPDAAAGDVGDLTNPNLMEYDGCPKDAVSCKLPDSFVNFSR